MTFYIIPVLAVGAALFYKFLIYPSFFSPLSKIPAANFTARFCPLWIEYIRFTRQENKTVYRLHKRLGPIIRMGPNELSINCPEGLKTIYGGGFQKHEFYIPRFAANGIRSMLTMFDNKEHSTRKRMLSHIYSKSYITSSPAIEANSRVILYDRVLPAIEHNSSTTTPMEMLSFNTAYAIDSMMAFQFGLGAGGNFLQNEKDHEWYSRKSSAFETESYWVDFPLLTRWASRLGIQLIPRSAVEALSELQQWQLEHCDRAEMLLATRSDIPIADMPTVLAQQRTAMRKLAGPSVVSQPQKYPYRLEIAAEMWDHSLAAHDTSSITLTYLQYELSRRPQLQSDLHRELLTLSPPFHRGEHAADAEVPDAKVLDSLPLLDAVLQETLRLYPAGPGGQPRVTPYPECSLVGYDNIPPSIRVQAAAYTMHRNPEAFPEPLEWKPERWLSASPKKLAEMRRWFWAFSSGGQMCIGLHFAIHIMKQEIAALYTGYTSAIVGEHDMEQADGFVAGPEGGKLVLQWSKV